MVNEKIEYLNLDLLHPFENNPFQSVDENEYDELRDSITFSMSSLIEIMLSGNFREKIFFQSKKKFKSMRLHTEMFTVNVLYI